MNILKFLDENRMTQQELGNALGTSNQNVNRWVTGKGVPSYEFCKKLLSMGMDVDDLFDINYLEIRSKKPMTGTPPIIKKEDLDASVKKALLDLLGLGDKKEEK